MRDSAAPRVDTTPHVLMQRCNTLKLSSTNSHLIPQYLNATLQHTETIFHELTFDTAIS